MRWDEAAGVSAQANEIGERAVELAHTDGRVWEDALTALRDAEAGGGRRGCTARSSTSPTGVTSCIVLGAEVNAANAAWQEWADAGGAGPYPDVSVHNHLVDLGLVIEAA